MKRFFHIIICIVALAVSLDAVAQRMPERGLVRKGNRQFARERYDRSADSYRQALEHDSTSFEARSLSSPSANTFKGTKLNSIANTRNALKIRFFVFLIRFPFK